MYDKTALTLGKLYDDMRALESYNNKIQTLIRVEYNKRKMDFHNYERLVNILTCKNLLLDDMKHKLNVLVDRQAESGMKIDVVV